MNKIKVAPSILSADFWNLSSDIKKVEVAGADMIHVDVMDGHFVPNITIGPLVVESIRGKTKLLLDVHLMIERPEKFISSFARAGADIISVHAEVCHDLHTVITQIKKEKVAAAVAINPITPITVVEKFLEDISLVLLMTVNPGFGGQKFIPEVLPKIKELRQIVDEKKLNIDIEVDGGINLETAAKVVKAGANVLVAGSAIYRAKDPVGVVKELKKL